MADSIIFETFLTSAKFKAYQYIAEYIESYVHVPTFLLNGESLEDFAAGYADVGFVSPLSYLWLLNQRPCPIELIAVPDHEWTAHDSMLPVFCSVVTRKDGPLASIKDLDSCSWAYHAGTAHDEDHFIGAERDFAVHTQQLIEASSQAQALQLVINKQADAALIDARRLDLVFRNSPHRAQQLRILATYSYAHRPLVVAAAYISPFVRRKIQEALAEIHNESLSAHYLQEISVERFIALTNAQYRTFFSFYGAACNVRSSISGLVAR